MAGDPVVQRVPGLMIGLQTLGLDPAVAIGGLTIFQPESVHHAIAIEPVEQFGIQRLVILTAARSV